MASLVVLGGLSRFIYWKEIGCLSGSCSITSSWINSSIYGAILGYLIYGIIADFFKPKASITK